MGEGRRFVRSMLYGFVCMKTLTLAGIVTEPGSELLPLLVASTGLAGAASRYALVLAGAGEDGIERATATGFFVGLGFGGLALLLEVLT